MSIIPLGTCRLGAAVDWSGAFGSQARHFAGTLRSLGRRATSPRRPSGKTWFDGGAVALLDSRGLVLIAFLSIARTLDDARRRAAVARPAADDQALARALRAPEQVGEGPGVADVAAVAQNYSAVLIRKLYLPPPLFNLNKIPLVIKGESPILAGAWWPISAGYQYGSGASFSIALAWATWALRGPPLPRLRARDHLQRPAGTPPNGRPGRAPPRA